MFTMLYFNIFYLPALKKVVGQHEMYAQLKVWYTQMMLYNLYFRRLIKLANDVEENPGPTILDIIDPSKTVSAD